MGELVPVAVERDERPLQSLGWEERERPEFPPALRASQERDLELSALVSDDHGIDSTADESKIRGQALDITGLAFQIEIRTLGNIKRGRTSSRHVRPFNDALVRSLERGELDRALESAVVALLGETAEVQAVG
jgi:hypothetical protein